VRCARCADPACRLINRIKPGSVARVNEPATMPFKKMENIANYLKAARALGVKEFEMFGTPDLFEEKNVQGVRRFARRGGAVTTLLGKGATRASLLRTPSLAQVAAM